MKHVGKMKNNGAKIVVAYRTLPGDPLSALVVGTGNLGESYHDSLMSLLQDVSGQNANEFAEILSARNFPDGSNMLAWLHTNGHLKKVPTNLVIMTPNSKDTIQLDELNEIIAKQKGVTIDELAVTENGKKAETKKKVDATKTTSSSVNGDEEPEIVVPETPAALTPAELRSRADALFKQAQSLRKQADEIDPPKSRSKKTAVETI